MPLAFLIPEPRNRAELEVVGVSRMDVCCITGSTSLNNAKTSQMTRQARDQALACDIENGKPHSYPHQRNSHDRIEDFRRLSSSLQGQAQEDK